MLEKIEKLTEEIKSLEAANADALEALRIKYLSKKGEIPSLLNDFRNVPNEQKKEAGQIINEVKQFIEKTLTEKNEEIKKPVISSACPVMLRLIGLDVDLTDALRVGFWMYITPEATGAELDFENRDELLREFDRRCQEKYANETDSWEKVDVARGMAVYDPDIDETVNKVVHRADQLMYENKRAGKEQQANT